MTEKPNRSFIDLLIEKRAELDVPRLIAVVALVLAAVALLFSGLRLNEYLDARDESRAEAKLAVELSALSSAAAVDELFESVKTTVDELAEDLSNGTVDDGLATRLASAPDGVTLTLDRSTCDGDGLDPSRLEPALCEAALAIAELNGIGVVFDPSLDPGNRYRPYANRIEGSLDLGELVARDFTSTSWFTSAATDGAGWVHPEFGLTSQKLLVYYSAPFFGPDQTFRGVLVATYALDQLANDLRWLDGGAVGYSIVLSETGQLVSHPTAALLDDDNSLIADAESGTVDTFRGALSSRANSGEGDASGLVDGLRDDLTGQRAWLAYAPISTLGWDFGQVAIERDVLNRTSGQSQLLIDVGLGVMMALILIALVVFGAHRGSPRSLWAFSITVALLLLAGLGWVWHLTLTGPGDVEATPTEDRLSVSVDAALDAETEPLFAGVFVQSVEFTGSNDVTVSGIVWQQQRSDADQPDVPGFVFPEADSATFTEQYRFTTGNLTRVGWLFTASLRQTFDYSRYPLDRETVWLRLWPANFELPWTMLPDLTSYETLAPSMHPGVEEDFVVEGWVLQGSSFSFVQNDYNTNFGLRDLALNPTPELYFNVHLQRSFIDSLMSQLVPVTVVAILLFSVLLITTRRRSDGESDRERDGGEPESDVGDSSALGVLGYCAALFFVVILSHADLRAKLNAHEVIYLEYFYFVAYLAILMVSANVMLVESGRGGHLIHFRNNVIPSLLFWPLFNGVLLAVTLITFY